MKNVLIVAPHPDDEIVGLGITIKKLLIKKKKIIIFFPTNGVVCQKQMWFWKRECYQDIVKIRTKEMKKSLNALGITVQNLTNGAFKKSMLMYSVSTGVAVGITLGIMKLIFGFSILYILVPGYILGIVLTYLSTEEFVNVGWDSAGVTTGPITVPLVLAMGLGFGKAVGAVEGFGILAAASISPIVAVLALGVYVQWRVKKDNERAALEAADDTAKA